MTEKEIQQLVDRVKSGDKDAFGLIYEEFVDRLYRYVFFRVDSEDAEDLLETVFVKAWENIGKYKATGDKFSSWLFRIAHNLVVDHYRLNHSIEAITEEYQEYRAEHHPGVSAERSLESNLLKKGLSALKDEYQQVLVLKYINDMPNSDVAAILGKSEGNLRVLQYRALRALRGVLQDMGWSQ
jgi:RNA polymerase sigma-70 factor (ECF subfamily)